MTRRRSLFRQIMGLVLAISLIYTSCLFLIVNSEMGSLLGRVRSNLLTSRLWEVGSYLGRDAHGHLVLNIPQIRMEFYARPGIDYVIRDETGHILFRSPRPWVDYTPKKTPPRDTVNEFEFKDETGRSYVGQSGWVTSQGVPYLIQVTKRKDDDFPARLRRLYFSRLAVLFIPFSVTLGFGIAWALRRALASLETTSRQAQTITVSNPEARLDMNDLPAEIKPVIEAFNNTLGRLEAGIIAQKEFIGNAAHELRTPLTILKGHLAILTDRDVKPKLTREVDSMSRLVDQLLAAARLEHAHILEMAAVDLVSVVRDACFDVWHLVVKQSLILDVSGGDTPVWIDGDYESLRRAIRNVLDNAIYHSPRNGTIAVNIRGSQISVSDQGPGIAKEDRERIFERFWRKDPRQGGGAGIGLFIVKTTMTLHGGSVHVEDAPGGGSRFVLGFPSSVSAAAA